MQTNVCIREHLYRVHLEQQPYCVRCGEIFSDESGVKAHLNRRPDEICDVVADVSVVGLSSYQMKQLRSKKRKPGVITIGEKWRHIYGIIFPDVTDFPDPCEQNPILVILYKLANNVQIFRTSTTDRMAQTCFQ